jgi:hypothetical protein
MRTGAAATAIPVSGSFNFQEKTHLKNRTASATTNSVAPAAAMIRKSSSIAGSFMGAVQGGQNASDDIWSCDLGPDACSHFRRFAGNPDRPARAGVVSDVAAGNVTQVHACGWRCRQLHRSHRWYYQHHPH